MESAEVNGGELDEVSVADHAADAAALFPRRSA